jgi:hypothetical protein
LEGLVDPIAAAPAATAAAVVVYLYICLSVCLTPVLQLLSSFSFLFLTTIFLTTTEPWLDLPSICLPICVCVCACMSGSLPPVFYNCNLPPLSSSSRQYP